MGPLVPSGDTQYKPLRILSLYARLVGLGRTSMGILTSDAFVCHTGLLSSPFSGNERLQILHCSYACPGADWVVQGAQDEGLRSGSL